MSDAATAVLGLEVFVSPTRPIPGGDRTFSPITSTLVYGKTDAVLVDAQFIDEDVRALGDMIEASGKKLTTIFITHGHGDHFFGCDALVARFPGARAVATPGVVDYIDAHVDADVRTWTALFGDAVTPPTSRPQRLESNVIDLEGEALRVIEVGQGDIAPSAILHVPSIGAVVAGDVAYNQIHQMLGFTGPEGWAKWIESVDAIEALRPRVVVAGHKKPTAPDDDAAAILDGTRRYIRDFAEAAATLGTAPEIVAAMRAKYPDHGNLTTLVYSAHATKPRAS